MHKRLAPIAPILGILALLVISILAFAGALPHGTVPGWIGLLALAAYASLLFIL